MNSVKMHIFTPFKNFAKAESTAGMILVCFALVAIILSNSPLSSEFAHFWKQDLSLSLGAWQVSKSLELWINEGLMTLFFFVVGLEIKRELVVGELSSLKKAVLPVVGALGGVVVPALIFLSFTWGTSHAKGWAIPTSTDIAFCLATLHMLGRRVPTGLKVFVVAAAIVDDLFGIIILAAFYSHGISISTLLLAFLPIALLVLSNRMDFRNPALYLILGFALWLLFVGAGIHATVAGVIVALSVPVLPKLDPLQFQEEIQTNLERFADIRSSDDSETLNRRRKSAILGIEYASVHAQSPLQRLEAGLHPLVAFLVLPLFALCNAGVALSVVDNVPSNLQLFLAVAAGLVIGKPIGIATFSYLSVKLGFASLPRNVNWSQIFSASILSGIGFTMSLFISSLSFENATLIEVSRFSILVASLIAWLLGFSSLLCSCRAGSSKAIGLAKLASNRVG